MIAADRDRRDGVIERIDQDGHRLQSSLEFWSCVDADLERAEVLRKPFLGIGDMGEIKVCDALLHLRPYELVCHRLPARDELSEPGQAWFFSQLFERPACGGVVAPGLRPSSDHVRA